MNDIKYPKWLSLREAAKWLGIGESTLARWVVERRIRAVKIGVFLRFFETELVAFVERSKLNSAV